MSKSSSGKGTLKPPFLLINYLAIRKVRTLKYRTNHTQSVRHQIKPRNPMEIQELYSKQQVFFNSNETKNISFRIEQLKKFRKILEENESELYAAIFEDFGKSEFETFESELSLLYHEINIFVKNIKRWSRRKKVSTGLINFPAKSYILPEPLGVTLVIGA
ncbi:MAG: acyl-CoA reductase-like NAD-dependent aldehyde dehydrogenase, partial [Lentimonas sp.]